MLTAQQIIDLLRLEPLTIEGGFFRETYRSKLTLSAGALPDEYIGERSVSTAIYYLLTPDTFSAIHRVKSDEVFHFYAGDPVEMLQLRPDGGGETLVLGNDLAAEHVPQVVVPGGVWQGCRLVEGGRWALMGCTVAPGFDYADFESGSRAELGATYPKFEDQIAALTIDQGCCWHWVCSSSALAGTPRRERPANLGSTLWNRLDDENSHLNCLCLACAFRAAHRNGR